jgi:hypothetical protein
MFDAMLQLLLSESALTCMQLVAIMALLVIHILIPEVAVPMLSAKIRRGWDD